MYLRTVFQLILSIVLLFLTNESWPDFEMTAQNTITKVGYDSVLKSKRFMLKINWKTVLTYFLELHFNFAFILHFQHLVLTMELLSYHGHLRNWTPGVYILSLNFKIAPKHAESALKIFIFAPIRTLRVMQYFKICTFCAIFWIIFQKIGKILIKLYL